ncbi:subunit of the phenylacetly-CoA oxygenase/reductase [Escherichia fergusonii]|nr:subunit of the phenylacetly-CoA oxygenase/reductase [Escherichia fergusonii]
MTTFHSLTVAKVEPETRDAVTITFAVPQPLQEAYRFRPGQHLTLKASLNGEELRRCYSICRSYLPGEISVAVKAIEGGRFSRYARDHIRPGDDAGSHGAAGAFRLSAAGRTPRALSGYCSRIRYYANAGDYRHHFTNRA